MRGGRGVSARTQGSGPGSGQEDRRVLAASGPQARARGKLGCHRACSVLPPHATTRPKASVLSFARTPWIKEGTSPVGLR